MSFSRAIGKCVYVHYIHLCLIIILIYCNANSSDRVTHNPSNQLRSRVMKCKLM